MATITRYMRVVIQFKCLDHCAGTSLRIIEQEVVFAVSCWKNVWDFFKNKIISQGFIQKQFPATWITPWSSNSFFIRTSKFDFRMFLFQNSVSASKCSYFVRVIVILDMSLLSDYSTLIVEGRDIPIFQRNTTRFHFISNSPFKIFEIDFRSESKNSQFFHIYFTF